MRWPRSYSFGERTEQHTTPRKPDQPQLHTLCLTQAVCKLYEKRQDRSVVVKSAPKSALVLSVMVTFFRADSVAFRADSVAFGAGSTVWPSEQVV